MAVGRLGGGRQIAHGPDQGREPVRAGRKRQRVGLEVPMVDGSAFGAFADAVAVAEEPVAFVGGDMKGEGRFDGKNEVQAVDRNQAASVGLRHGHPSAGPRSDIAPLTAFLPVQRLIGIPSDEDFHLGFGEMGAGAARRVGGESTTQAVMVVNARPMQAMARGLIST